MFLFIHLHHAECGPHTALRNFNGSIMRNEAKRDMVLKIAFSYLGKPYIWGGDDFSGFDCSGFVIECLKSIGSLPRKGDWTAAALYHKFPIKPANGKAGDLVFWANTEGGRIIHVEICVNDDLSIGASGGGSTTKTEADAIRQNAFIKIRPMASRKYLRGFCNPYV